MTEREFYEEQLASCQKELDRLENEAKSIIGVEYARKYSYPIAVERRNIVFWKNRIKACDLYGVR